MEHPRGWSIPTNGASPWMEHPHRWSIPMDGASPPMEHPCGWSIPADGASPPMEHPRRWSIPTDGASPLMKHPRGWSIPTDGASLWMEHPHQWSIPADGASPWFNPLPGEPLSVRDELPGCERGSPLCGEGLKMGFSQGRKPLQPAKNTHRPQLPAPPWLYLQRGGAWRGCRVHVPGVAASEPLEIPKGRCGGEMLWLRELLEGSQAPCRGLGISCVSPGEKLPAAGSLIRSSRGAGHPSAARLGEACSWPCGSSRAVPAWSCQPEANLQPVSKNSEKQEDLAVRRTRGARRARRRGDGRGAAGLCAAASQEREHPRTPAFGSVRR